MPPTPKPPDASQFWAEWAAYLEAWSRAARTDFRWRQGSTDAFLCRVCTENGLRTARRKHNGALWCPVCDEVSTATEA